MLDLKYLAIFIGNFLIVPVDDLDSGLVALKFGLVQSNGR